jgi:hypothetical protein
MIEKTNKQKFVSQRTILKKTIILEIEKSETQSVSSWARFIYLRDQVLNTILIKSLILAQDERWRRA